MFCLGGGDRGFVLSPWCLAFAQVQDRGQDERSSLAEIKTGLSKL